MLQQTSHSDERRLQRELRFICIMGPPRRSEQGAPSELVSMGLIDETGWVTPKGKEFMMSDALA